MKINKSNHNHIITAEVAEKLSPELKEAYDFFSQFSELYDEDKDIQEAIDLYLENVNDWAAEHLKASATSSSGKSKKSKATKTIKTDDGTAKPAKKKTTAGAKKSKATAKKKPVAQKKKTTSAAEKKNTNRKPTASSAARRVNKISPEVRFAKRAKNLHGKVATKRQIAALVKALQRAILKKEIRKNSPHADFIMDLQRLSVNFHNGMKGSTEKFNLPETLYKKTVDLSDDERVKDSVRLINRYIGLINTDKTEAMQRLLSAIEKAIDQDKVRKEDEYYAVISNISKKLKNHTSNHTVLDATPTELSGLQDVLSKLGIRPAKPAARKKAVKKK
jgi:hypothetical protein